MARLKGWGLDPSFFSQLDDYINDNKRSVREVRYGIDKFVAGTAYVALSEAQSRSMGPLDPSGRRNSRAVATNLVGGHVEWAGPLAPTKEISSRRVEFVGASWKIPVRRITEAYLKGWYVERIGYSIYLFSNRSREAYYIEFGINHEGTGLTDSAGQKVRIRRPVMRLSVTAALTIVNSSRSAENMVTNAFRVTTHHTGSPAHFEVASEHTPITYGFNEVYQRVMGTP